MSGTQLHKYCVIGTPVSHSRSPELFAHIFAERGLEKCCEYTINEIRTEEELKDFLGEMRIGKWAGCNVTMPWKTKVAELADELTPRARLMNSVNTLKRLPDGTLIGDSTDGVGLIKAVEKRTAGTTETDSTGQNRNGQSISDYKVLLLGAGGAARSVLAALTEAGVRDCSVVCRDSRNRQLLVEILRQQNIPIIDFGDTRQVLQLCADSDLIINCTPLGMIPQEDMCPLPDNAVFKPGAIIADAVYNPSETLLLKRAAAKGCVCVTGLDMLTGQAEAAAEFLLD